VWSSFWGQLYTGTSPSLPIPPTGKDLVLEGCVLVHLQDGLVVEEWEYSDYLGFLQQLGVVPALG
jgi:predicted ester cyclase